MRIEPLAAHHALSGFRSGERELDRYFKGQARRDVKRRLAAAFVLTLPDGAVAGAYSLAPGTLLLPDLLAGVERKISRYPLMPAARLVKLVVDQRHRGQGHGRTLLADAIRRVRASAFASVVMIAEAADPQGAAFYQNEGFFQFPDRPDRLFRPMADFALSLRA